jgi:tetratricopeptide (TPR) repeat protein
MRQGKMEKALDTFQKAIPLNRLLQSEIYNNLGLIYFALGRMEEGETASRKSIEIRPYHAAPYYNLGVYHEKKGDIDQAIYHYEIAAKLSPDYTLCHEALSQLYERKGWKEKSQKAYRNYLRYSLRK